MQRSIARMLLLVFAALLVGAATATAQTSVGERVRDELRERLAAGEQGVLVGVRNEVSLPAGETADAVLVLQGRALIEGAAQGLVMIDSDVVIQGEGSFVDGIFAIGGTLTVGPGATVQDIRYIDTIVDISASATVTGVERDIQNDLTEAALFIVTAFAILAFLVWIGFGLATIVWGLLLVAFGTSQARRAARTIGNDVLKVIAVGLLAAILPWIVFALLAITVVGLPLALGLMIMWVFVAFLGYLVVGLWIGERIPSKSRNAARPYKAALLGVIILLLLSWIPLVSLGAVWLGLGAVTLAGWRVLRGRGSMPQMPPGPGGPYGQPAQMPPPPYPAPPYAAPPPGGPAPQAERPPQNPPPDRPSG